jgi:prepilin-type processing-associated H-X9-DG protein
MISRPLGFALAFCVFVACACAFTQPQNDEPSVSQAPLGGPAFFTVTRVDADGTIVLGPSEMVPPQFQERLASSIAEGLYLLVTNDSKPGANARVLRVQVTDVGGSVFTLKAGPRAAARVQVNDSARLVRPFPATTAGLRALPDEILFEARPVDAGMDDARETAARPQSINNLKQIGLAMHNFASANGQFPPAVIFGPDGKPWHSWRVLLLPFLEQMALYNAYDFSQPWDSPKNKPLIDKMPSVYRDPIYGDARESYTNYAAFVGPNAIFRPAGAQQKDPKNLPLAQGGVGFQNITDGTSNTVMVSSVEPARKIPWTKPEDIDVGPAFKGFGQPGGIAAPYTFRGPGGGKSAPFLFADGSVRTIGTSIHAQTLTAILTCQGGEIIDFNALPTESVTSVAQNRTLRIRVHGRKVTAAIESEMARAYAPAMPPPTKALLPFRKAQR